MSINSFRIYLSIAFFLLVAEVKGQTYSFRNLTNEDGLAGAAVFDILQDHKGYLWFATSHGVSRFDGTSFKNYTSNDGLTDNSVIRIFEDRYGGLWFATFNGSLCKFHGDRMVPHPLDEQIKAFASNYLVENFFVDAQGSHWVCTNYGGIGRIAPGASNVQPYHLGSEGEEVNLFFQYLPEGLIFGFNDFPVIDSSPTQVKYGNDSWTLRFSLTEFARSRRKFFCRMDYDDVVFSFCNKLFRVKGGEVVFEKEFNSDIATLYKDKQGDLWVSLIGNGIFRYPGGVLTGESQHLFEDETISKVFNDTEGNYWFSSIENGLYFLSGFDFQIYRFGEGRKQNRIVSLDIRNNKLFYTTSDHQLFFGDIEDGKLSSIEEIPVDGKTKNSLRVYTPAGGKDIWLSGAKYLKYTEKGEPKSLSIMEGSTYNKSNRSKLLADLFTPRINTIYKGSNGRVYAGFRYGVWEFENQGMLSYSRAMGLEQNVNCFAEDDQNRLWIGTNEGLYCNSDGSYINYNDSLHWLKDRIMDVANVNGEIWVATNRNGVIIDLLGKKLKLQDVLDDDLSQVVKIIPYRDSTVFVTTIKGLSRIDIKGGQPYRVDNYSKLDGLPTNEINDVAVHGDFLWLGTKKGLVCFNAASFSQKEIPPRGFIDRIQINGRDTTLQDSFILEADQNSLGFEFEGIEFKNSGTLQFRYQLVGLNETPIYTKDKMVHFPQLAPGEYRFYLDIGDGVGNWRKNPIQVFVKIKYVFYKKLIFLILLGVFSLSLLLLIVLQLIKIQKKRVEVKRSFLISQQKALSGQMNPHFMFNSLNSIQSFIVGKDEEMTDVYLSNFSSLMRMILENSKEFKISLRRVIDTLNLYMDLEKLRFEDNFCFQVCTEEEIDQDAIKIPPMLVQPFVENAIWHGIMPSPRQGKLVLDFRILDGGYLLCVVVDNGIGRRKALDIKKRRGGPQFDGNK
jgi:ligand-binding sensor domain-containing protein